MPFDLGHRGAGALEPVIDTSWSLGRREAVSEAGRCRLVTSGRKVAVDLHRDCRRGPAAPAGHGDRVEAVGEHGCCEPVAQVVCSDALGAGDLGP
jgi:hypothetical protein